MGISGQDRLRWVLTVPKVTESDPAVSRLVRPWASSPSTSSSRSLRGSTNGWQPPQHRAYTHAGAREICSDLPGCDIIRSGEEEPPKSSARVDAFYTRGGHSFGGECRRC